ncbi:MAG TPA: hypothetical protein VKT51_12710 [Candidatus Eremiobacteraceae bacterium]|nr:hypothetical protein [Candidatus Eremiobacteraceae bacterium]
MINPIFVHFVVALIVIAALIVAVITPLGRRVAMWSLALQLLVGLWLIFLGFRVSPWHPALWLLAALFTQAAIFAGKRERKAGALILTLLALASAAGAFYVGLVDQPADYYLRRPVQKPSGSQSRTILNSSAVGEMVVEHADPI